MEDQPDVGAPAAKALSDLGYTVLEADGPLEAIELSRNQTSAIQLLVCDAVTHGMPGDVLLGLVKQFHPNIKVLFVSSRGEELTMVENAPEAGFDYLPKPFSPAALALKVREVLDRD